MASKITVERKIYYSSAIDKTNVDTDFSFGTIYSIGYKNFSSTSSHSVGVKNSIPPYSIINSVTMGVDNGSISIKNDSTIAPNAYYWYLAIKARYRYVTSDGDNSSKLSGTIGATADFTKSGNPNSFSDFSSTVSNYKYGGASDFSSGTENAGLLKAFDENNSYTNNETEYLQFHWTEGGAGVNASALAIKNSQPYITYKITLPTITLLSNDAGMGTIKGPESDNIYNIDVSSSYSVTAEPKPGYRFIKWSDGKKERTRTFTKMDLISSDTKFTAEFIPYYTISYNLNGGHTSETRINFYDSLYGALDSNLSPTGVSEIILPTPSKTGYTFIGWTGTNIEEPSKAVTIPLGSSGNRNYTANWQINQYKVTLESSPSDAAIVKAKLKDGTEFTDSMLLDYNTQFALISATNQNTDKYVFEKFSRTNKTDLVGESNSILTSETVPSWNITYTAHYNLRKYSISAKSILITKDEDGRETETQEDCAIFELNGSSSFDDQEYGKTIYISFLPKFGYKFVKWKGVDLSKANNSVLETQVYSDIYITACFEKINPIENSLPDNIETLPTEEKNNLIISLANSIVNKTIINYINTVQMSKIGDYAFYKCENLKFVNIPNIAMSALGKYSFCGCKNLTSIRIPENITRINSNAFANCINLTTLILPRISSIVEMESIDILLNTPFNQSLYQKKFGYIYVPKDLIGEYQTDTNWCIFAEHFRTIEDYPEICGG